MTKNFKLISKDGYWLGQFQAMASPCEILIETEDLKLASSLTELAYDEALRIEHKLSRYRKDNVIYEINNSNGQPITVDEETALLLDYADQCFKISDGLFDITSGVLRKIWKFDGSDSVPTNKQVKAILPLIGWQKTNWQQPRFILPKGMEIDLGGIGKEYAVDRTAMLIRAKAKDTSVLINFGGDLYATRAKNNGEGWVIGIEQPQLNEDDLKLSNQRKSLIDFQLKQGGIATSGDIYRYLLKEGIRYSHILNPKTGWPVNNAPNLITVVAESCIEAGILATLAMLNEKSARKFLKEQGVQFWIS